MVYVQFYIGFMLLTFKKLIPAIPR